jgi:hypothetical protein
MVMLIAAALVALMVFATGADAQRFRGFNFGQGSVCSSGVGGNGSCQGAGGTQTNTAAAGNDSNINQGNQNSGNNSDQDIDQDT